MPAFDPNTLSRTSSAAFFRLSETAYTKQRHNARAADAAVEATLDLYIADDRIPDPRTIALDRGKRLFKRCMMHHGDPSMRSAIWFGTVRSLEKRVPDFALARDLEWIRQVADLEAAIEAPTPEVLAEYGLNPDTFDRYLRAPMMGFLHSADLRSVWALGLCQRFSADEVSLLSRLSSHPALPAVTAIAGGLDATFFEGLLEEGSGEETEDSADEGSSADAASEADAASTTAGASRTLSDAASYADAASTSEADDATSATRLSHAGAVCHAGGAGDTADTATEPSANVDASSVAPQRRREMLQKILTTFGLEELALAMLHAMVATPPEGRQDMPETLAESMDALAKDYVTYVAQDRLEALADEDLDGLFEIVCHPLAARVAKNPTRLMGEILEVVGDLLAEGIQERSRKRVRDDATDCTQGSGLAALLVGASRKSVSP